jgi:osmotically-inducible protein OsmY
VDNRVAIHESESVSVLKDGVEAAIRRTMPLEARAITVEVHGHRLTLSGRVRSSSDRRRVEHLAWAAAGVTTVDNDIVISS